MSCFEILLFNLPLHQIHVNMSLKFLLIIVIFFLLTGITALGHVAVDLEFPAVFPLLLLT